jgi:hypothetical protein
MALNVNSTKQALVDLVNASNKKKVTLAKVTVGAPTPDQSQPTTNTLALFTAIKGKGFRGTRDVFYTRLSQAEAFGNDAYESRAVVDPFNSSAEEIIAAVISDIATAWSLPLDKAGELTDFNYEVVGGLDDIVVGVVTASAAGNYVLRGELKIHVMNPKIPLPTVITKQRLEGFKEEDVVLEDNG